MAEAANVLKEMQDKMGKAVQFVLHEFDKIHTGKANPSMVENILVEAYGATMKLKEMAAISTPEPRMISIQPWDRSVSQSITKAIQKANIGFNPIDEGGLIRCPVPELSGDRRKEMVKSAHATSEEGKVRIRDARRDAIAHAKDLQKKGILPEDEAKRLEKDIQSRTDQFIKDIETHLSDKERELMKV